jgi:hypothetical protein
MGPAAGSETSKKVAWLTPDCISWGKWWFVGQILPLFDEAELGD